MSGMNKGYVWVNGNQLGRYWSIISSGSCTPCDYRGNYDGDHKCRIGCGRLSQQYYHVPREWLKPAGSSNLVVILEETTSGDPSAVRLVRVN